MESMKTKLGGTTQEKKKEMTIDKKGKEIEITTIGNIRKGISYATRTSLLQNDTDLSFEEIFKIKLVNPADKELCRAREAEI